MNCYRCYEECGVISRNYFLDYGLVVEANLCDGCTSEFNIILKTFFKEVQCIEIN